MKKYIPLLLAVAILVGACIYGNSMDKMDAEVVEGYYRQVATEADHFEAITDKTAKIVDASGAATGYIGVSSDVGYGGPLVVATLIDLDGNIQSVNVVEHKETISYLKKIADKGYFKQYEKKTVTDSLMPLYDIDCISGATLSSRAIGNSVRDVSHAIATTELGKTPEKAKIDWQIGIKEIAVALLFVVALILSRVKKLGKFRLVLLLASVGILGFWLNRSLSVAQISALFLGYFPAPQTNLIWYLVLIGAIIPALVTGKNFYCTYVCPFCGLQEATHFISKTNLPLGKNIKWMKVMRDVFLFAVIFVAFITLNPSTTSYEPFGTIFGLNGSKFGWYLIFAVLVVSFFFKRFWCTAFCPVGAFLDKLAMIGRDVKKALGIGKNKKASAQKPASIDAANDATIDGAKGLNQAKEAVKAETKTNLEAEKAEKAEKAEATGKTKKTKIPFLLYISYAVIAICVIMVLIQNFI